MYIDCTILLLQGVFFFIFYVLRHDRMRPKLRKALALFRKWCWQKCSVCHRVTDSELVPSPSTEEPRPLQQDNGESDVCYLCTELHTLCNTDVAVRVIAVLFLGAYNGTWSAKQY